MTPTNNSALSRICTLFGRARDRVTIVSAYLGSTALAQVLDSVPKSVADVAIFARWDLQDIASGATDWQAWDVARDRGVRLYACAGLHAKMYVADGEALVGSANATASGLGLGGRGNIELLMAVDTSQPDVSRVLATVESGCVEAPPLGADTMGSVASASEVVPIWIPEVNPNAFLDVVLGRARATDTAHRMFAALGLSKDSSEAALRTAARSTTAFRVVKEQFDTRPVSMAVAELRDLLVGRVDSRCSNLSSEQLALLVQWLGRFGANTHSRTPDKGLPRLYAGERLASFPDRIGRP